MLSIKFAGCWISGRYPGTFEATYRRDLCQALPARFTSFILGPRRSGHFFQTTEHAALYTRLQWHVVDLSEVFVLDVVPGLEVDSMTTVSHLRLVEEPKDDTPFLLPKPKIFIAEPMDFKTPSPSPMTLHSPSNPTRAPQVSQSHRHNLAASFNGLESSIPE